MIPAWVGSLVGVLAETAMLLIKGATQGKSEAELAAIAAESVAAQGALMVEQHRVLREAQKLVPGFTVEGG